MNTEWLQEYIVFARHLNFSSAAKTLNMAQPTLSKHMIALEKWVGVPLIERGGSPQLTYYGHRFLECAQSTLTTLNSGVKACRELKHSNRPVRVQWFDHGTYLSDRLPRVKGIPFELTNTSTEGLDEPYFAVLDNDLVDIVSSLDFSIMPDFSKAAQERGIKTAATVAAPAALAMSAEHPLSRIGKLQRADLTQAEFLIVDRAYYDLWRSYIAHVLGGDLNLHLTLKSVHGVTANMGSIDLGRGIVFYTAEELRRFYSGRDDVVIIEELDGAPLSMPLGILYREDNENPLVHQLARHLTNNS